MIYLITGLPGSGKTLYAVSVLLRQILAERVEGPTGPVDRRLCVEGIPGLVLPHELMAAPSMEFLSTGKRDDAPEGNGLWNWPDWAKPGDLICVDEVQRYWRPRGMGTKVPADVAALETHRHKGLDFVLITQNPMLLDQNVRRLVGRHIHARRMFGRGAAVLYDWDGCQADVTRTSGAVRSVFRYPRDAFKLYRSAEVHTKQLQRLPAWLVLPVAALVAGAFLVPKAYEVLHKGPTSASPGTMAKAPAVPASGPGPLIAPVPGLPQPPGSGVPLVGQQTAAVSPRPGVSPVALEPARDGAQSGRVHYVGCIATANRCSCYEPDGYRAELPMDACRTEVATLRWLDLTAPARERSPVGRGADARPVPVQPVAPAAAVAPALPGGGALQFLPVAGSSPDDVLMADMRARALERSAYR